MSLGYVKHLRCKSWMHHGGTSYRQTVITMTARLARREAKRNLREAVAEAPFAWEPPPPTMVYYRRPR